MFSSPRHRWFVVATFFTLPQDIATLRGQLRERAEYEKTLAAAGLTGAATTPIKGKPGPQPA
jgi:hypothetical protein